MAPLAASPDAVLADFPAATTWPGRPLRNIRECGAADRCARRSMPVPRIQMLSDASRPCAPVKSTVGDHQLPAISRSEEAPRLVIEGGVSERCRDLRPRLAAFAG